MRLLAVLACAGLAACGSKDKGKAASTGPRSSSDPSSMNEGGPVAEPGAQPPGAAGGGDGAGPAQPGTDPGAGPGEEPPPPPIVPPNLDLDPDQARAGVEVHLRTGRQALNERSLDPDRAIGEARAALAIDATNVDAVVIMAHAYYHKRLYDTTEVILDMLFKERPASKNNPGVYYVYGLVYDKINEKQKAELAYKKAVELDPNFTSALINLGVHQLANKQYREATATYEKVTGQLGKNDAESWNSLASAYRGRSSEYDPGSPERDDWLRRAETAYKRAISADRSYGPTYYNLGLLYLDAEPFPGDGGPMDTLLRLQRAKAYFDEYKSMPGADMTLFEERAKDVSKLIKREEKARKKKEKEKASPEG